MKHIKTKTFQFETRGQLIIATAMVTVFNFKEVVNVTYGYVNKPGEEVDSDELTDLDMKPVFNWATKLGIQMGGY